MAKKTIQYSKYKGVTWARQTGRWKAQVCIRSRSHYAGTFDTAEEAARAYDKKALEMLGPDTELNFPQDDQ